MNIFTVILWLLLSTKAGRILLGGLIVAVVIYVMGWDLVPYIVAIIAMAIAVFFFDAFYYDFKRHIRRNRMISYLELIGGIAFLLIAIFLPLFLLNVFDRCGYNRVNRQWDEEPYETVVDTVPDMSDSTAIDKEEKPVKIPSYSSSSHAESYERDDDMTGFDPASEDDMDDNGMDRYFDNYDEEGWE